MGKQKVDYKFPRLGEYLEALMARLKITTRMICNEGHVGGTYCHHMKKGGI